MSDVSHHCAHGTSFFDSDSIFFTTFLPTAVPALVALVGFFVFHKLASKRQRKSEVFETFKNLKVDIDEICTLSGKLWRMNGKDAVESGEVTDLRQKLSRAREELRLLVNFEFVFNGCDEKYTNFKKCIDEEIDQSGNPITTIDDIVRQSGNSWYQNGILPAANSLYSSLNKAFKDMY
ncbi:hypothetical protein [Hwanghaeella sp. LZ110]|uniref:hypothetical protein n=1 Tax=Hwanghaeella sp. LZ110 TaxID=3402810 RepID=UPI003B6783BC